MPRENFIVVEDVLYLFCSETKSRGVRVRSCDSTNFCGKGHVFSTCVFISEHLGANTTLRRVQDLFYWKGMKVEIKE